MYFVTICTREKEHFFGKIKNEKMILNEIGKIAEKFWQEIPKHFSFIILDAYVVMPNHLHGIVEILKNPIVETQFIASKTNNVVETNNVVKANNTPITNDSSKTNIISKIQDTIICQDAFSHQDAFFSHQDALKCVSTENAENNKKSGGITGLKNPSLNPASLSNIIKWYKGRCAFEINKQFPNLIFHWQPRFHDHIIRNDESLNKIREYVFTNQEMWERDRNNIENLWI